MAGSRCEHDGSSEPGKQRSTGRAGAVGRVCVTVGRVTAVGQRGSLEPG